MMLKTSNYLGQHSNQIHSNSKKHFLASGISYIYIHQILINCGISEEIAMHRGLMQGDFLAPFLFLLVAELMRRASELGFNFNIFKVDSNCISGFIIIICRWHIIRQWNDQYNFMNVWALKALLRDFKLMLGLKFDFHKEQYLTIL